MNLKYKLLLPTLAVLMLPSIGITQVNPPQEHFVASNIASGHYRGTDHLFHRAFSHKLSAGNVPWVQVNFGEYSLGNSSYVRLTSLHDDTKQTLNAQSMDIWNGSSGMLRGGDVFIELYVAKSDDDVFLEIAGWTHGQFGGPAESLCDGDDDRLPSFDPRVGRQSGGCTAFLISNGAVLTAGHCPSTGIVEFNVPPSMPDGTPLPAAIDDQYPITNQYGVFWNDGDGQVGRDWRVLSLGPNSQTGLSAHRVQGFIRCTTGLPDLDSAIRITGFGVDDTPLSFNRTQQTDTGPFTGEGSDSDGIYLRYRADTRGSNSGSPVFWDQQNVAIGIHTNAGCNVDSDSANFGTSFELNELESAINQYWGNTVEQVDRNHPPLQTPDGSALRPWSTIQTGINALGDGGVLVVVEGSYDEPMVISKPMTIRAPVGTVTIGQ